MDVGRRLADAPHAHELAVLVEHLDAAVVAIVDVDEVLDRIDRDAVDAVEVVGPRLGLLRGPLALLAPRRHVVVVLVVLHHARVRVAVSDEIGAVRIPGDEGRPIEVLRIRGVHVRLAERLQQLLAVVREDEHRVAVVVHDEDALLRIVRADVDRVRTAEHLVPLRPRLDDVPLRVGDVDDVRPLEVGAVDADVGVVTHLPVDLERSGRRRGGRIAPRQPADWELDVRPQLRQLDRLRPLDVRQQPALQDEHVVRRFGEDEFAGAPRPLLEPGQLADWLGPVRHDVVGAERILPALFARDRGETGVPRLPLQRRGLVPDRDADGQCGGDDGNHRNAHSHVSAPWGLDSTSGGREWGAGGSRGQYAEEPATSCNLPPAACPLT